MYEHVQQQQWQQQLTCCCLYFVATPPSCPCLTFVISICSLAAHCVNPNAFPFNNSRLLHFFPLSPSVPLFPSGHLSLWWFCLIAAVRRVRYIAQNQHARHMHTCHAPLQTPLPSLLYASVYLCFVELIDRHFYFTFHFCFHFHFRLCLMP